MEHMSREEWARMRRVNEDVSVERGTITGWLEYDLETGEMRIYDA